MYLAGQIEVEDVLLDFFVAPFEPLTSGSGGDVVEKKEKLANAIKERLSEEDLERLRCQLAGRPLPPLVSVKTN